MRIFDVIDTSYCHHLMHNGVCGQMLPHNRKEVVVWKAYGQWQLRSAQTMGIETRANPAQEFSSSLVSVVSMNRIFAFKKSSRKGVWVRYIIDVLGICGCTDSVIIRTKFIEAVKSWMGGSVYDMECISIPGCSGLGTRHGTGSLVRSASLEIENSRPENL